MSQAVSAAIRGDCLAAAAPRLPALRALGGQRLAVTGGSGFLGTWIAELVTALNDEFQLRIKLDIISPSASTWLARHERFRERLDVRAHDQDVRSPFEFAPDVCHVIHAAGVPDGRMHSSDPLRVFQTTVLGTENALLAASRLPTLARFLNVSSGLVYGGDPGPAGFTEESFGPVEVGQVSNIYAEAKRAAESLCAIYRSQLRLPVVTVRPFTFIGPFQDLQRPWALNNFLLDALSRREIRVHGDGNARRSFLYGSDAASWALVALVEGRAGHSYNLGSAGVVTLGQLAEEVAMQVSPRSTVRYRTLPNEQLRQKDFFPSIEKITNTLGVEMTVDLPAAVAKTIAWHKRGAGC